MLGIIFAVLSAATFALNNASARRGVVTGTPRQGMAVSIPVGVLCFLPLAIVTGEIFRIAQFPARAAGWMAGVGVLHFIFGRYCNYSASQAAGVNVTAPVIQLQVIVTLVLAVAILGEPCTALQVIGGILIFSGSIITQRQGPRANVVPTAPGGVAVPKRVFEPHYMKGYVYAIGAALAYGSSPIMARFALEHTGPASGILGGLIAYTAATVVAAFALLWPPFRREIRALKRDNGRWFAFSGVCVAMAQGFFFSAVAVAPILLVMPILQTSLVFRLLFANWINPDHEVFGWRVYAGVVISIAGALLVSVDTGTIVHALALPNAIARALLWRL